MEEGKFARDSAITVPIGGINVKFPVKPYPSQLSMMSMIIRGLQKRQHCLLESPTGSGKSLALLCSALAWQQAQYDKPDDELIMKLKPDIEKETPACTCGKSNKASGAEGTGPTTSKYFGEEETDGSSAIIDLCTPEKDEDDDFKSPGKQAKASKSKVDTKSATCPACNRNTSEEKGCCEEEKVRRPKVPKIWFGTRTHKQIAQIAKELGRTSYDMAKMTILSSRQHSCIHPAVMKSANKNEECRDLRRGTHALGAKCAFYQNVHRMKSHYQLACAGMGPAWDLEELVGLGNTIKACPFYSARELVSSSNIIFCPYNYLIDPLIRTQMQINLNNQIVILDEGHNIEDSARDAGSFTMTEDNLANTTADLEYLINDGVKTEDHRPLHLLCMRLGQWINQHSRNLKSSAYETSSEVWFGKDIINHLREWGITQDTLPLLEGNFQAAVDLGEEDIETAKILHSSSQATLGGLFNVLRYLMMEEYKYCDDYRITIIRQSVFGPVPPKRTREGWVTLHKKSKKHFVTNLHFWCLNPAVAFNDLSKAHCIILTSGTLSPMSTFSSELGLAFPIQLEANHVIHDSQVWVGAIGKGPRGIQLEATYKNTDKFEFQDELGELVNRICHIVPYGVLCFFSSYSMLQKLQERWKPLPQQVSRRSSICMLTIPMQNDVHLRAVSYFMHQFLIFETTGLWGRMQEVKVIVCEPRSSNKAEFDFLLQSFYDAVAESDTEENLTGALLFAVCRGKVSEGLDFADNNARAVITVGIPFPSIKDKQVELKRKYNDMHKSQRGLLSGGQWYEIQAFRAMNQALGRCIRHRNDWGALIIVDERFCKNPQKYSKGLSKWVRQKMRPHVNYESGISNLTAFVQRWSTKNGPLMLNGTTSPNDKVSTLTSQDAGACQTQEPAFSMKHEAGEGTKTPAKLPSLLTTDASRFSSSSPHTSSILTEPKNELKILKIPIPQDDALGFQEIPKTPFASKSESKMDLSKSGKSKSNEKTKHKSAKSQKAPKIEKGKEFSEDEIVISSDEDFQISTITKTPKSNIKKRGKDEKNNMKNKILVVSIESPQHSNTNTDLVVEEDLFDCTIPATPEKADLTIIPESPASTRKKPLETGENNSKTRQALDFTKQQPTTPQSSRKRKSSSPTHADILTPSSKRSGSVTRKASCDETVAEYRETEVNEDKKDEVSTVTEQGSGELLPRSKRRMRKKNTPQKSLSEVSSHLQCNNCLNSFYSTTNALEIEKIESKYIRSHFKKTKSKSSCKVYIVDNSAVTTGSLTLIYGDQGLPVELNSHWCPKDHKCYQAYKCSDCSQLVAFQIVSDPALQQKYIFSHKVVTTGEPE